MCESKSNIHIFSENEHVAFDSESIEYIHFLFSDIYEGDETDEDE